MTDMARIMKESTNRQADSYGKNWQSNSNSFSKTGFEVFIRAAKDRNDVRESGIHSCYSSTINNFVFSETSQVYRTQFASFWRTYRRLVHSVLCNRSQLHTLWLSMLTTLPFMPHAISSQSYEPSAELLYLRLERARAYQTHEGTGTLGLGPWSVAPSDRKYCVTAVSMACMVSCMHNSCNPCTVKSPHPLPRASLWKKLRRTCFARYNAQPSM